MDGLVDDGATFVVCETWKRSRRPSWHRYTRSSCALSLLADSCRVLSPLPRTLRGILHTSSCVLRVYPGHSGITRHSTRQSWSFVIIGFRRRYSIRGRESLSNYCGIWIINHSCAVCGVAAMPKCGARYGWPCGRPAGAGPTHAAPRKAPLPLSASRGRRSCRAALERRRDPRLYVGAAVHNAPAQLSRTRPTLPGSPVIPKGGHRDEAVGHLGHIFDRQ
jgi:hypothetical protein